VDSLTHIVLGACIGEAIAGKKLGRKAMLLGAIAQSLPDMDFVTAFFLSDTQDIVAHRGITHSLLFIVVGTLVLSFLSDKIFRKTPLSYKSWFLLFGINLFVHVFIDSFNAYGTGWFEPFSHRRFSFNVLFVIDPFFSIWPFLGMLGLLILRGHDRRRKRCWEIGIGMSVLYLGYAITNKLQVDKVVRENLAAQHIPADHYFTIPTIMNTWLWEAVVRKDDGYYLAYRSVFDRNEQMSFTWFPRQDSLLDLVENKEEVKDLQVFANGYYTVERRNDTLIFNVLRFGQIAGWENPKARFTFYYYCDRPEANNLVVQRGRFEGWDLKRTGSFIRRIKGN
jgi:inner membrane protein